MVTVGVRDLKNQLSRYLRLVKTGENVIITEHNRVIAEISVPRDRTDHAVPMEKTENTEQDDYATVLAEFQRLASEGRFILAKRRKSCAPIPPPSPKIDWWEDYEAVRDS